MRRKHSIFLIPMGFCFLASAACAGEKAAGGTLLLTAQNQEGELAGWRSFSEQPNAKTRDVWTLTPEGVLVCKGTPKGYIYTEKNYANFVLKLQWRTAPGKKPASGGVLIRTSGKHKIWPKSLEAQLNAGSEGDFWGLDGYELGGPAERVKVVPASPFGKLTNLKRARDAVKRAGEWNQYEIIADGPTVILKINGQVVNQATGCNVISGPICLTAEGDEIHFRDVRLTPNH